MLSGLVHPVELIFAGDVFPQDSSRHAQLQKIAMEAGWRCRICASPEAFAVSSASDRSNSWPVVFAGDLRLSVQLASKIGVEIIGPPSDWFRAIPSELLGKSFFIQRRGGEYQTGRARVTRKALFDVRVIDVDILSVEVTGRRESSNPRCFPLGSNTPTTEEEKTRCAFFLGTLMADDRVRLPPVFGMTIGEDDNGALHLDGMETAPETASPNGDWSAYLIALRRAWRQPGELLPQEEEWRLSWREGLLVRQDWVPPSDTQRWFPPLSDQ